VVWDLANSAEWKMLVHMYVWRWGYGIGIEDREMGLVIPCISESYGEVGGDGAAVEGCRFEGHGLVVWRGWNGRCGECVMSGS
jgi:hypothetical protein